MGVGFALRKTREGAFQVPKVGGTQTRGVSVCDVVVDAGSTNELSRVGVDAKENHCFAVRLDGAVTAHLCGDCSGITDHETVRVPQKLDCGEDFAGFVDLPRCRQSEVQKSVALVQQRLDTLSTQEC